MNNFTCDLVEETKKYEEMKKENERKKKEEYFKSHPHLTEYEYELSQREIDKLKTICSDEKIKELQDYLKEDYLDNSGEQYLDRTITNYYWWVQDFIRLAEKYGITDIKDVNYVSSHVKFKNAYSYIGKDFQDYFGQNIAEKLMLSIPRENAKAMDRRFADGHGNGSEIMEQNLKFMLQLNKAVKEHKLEEYVNKLFLSKGYKILDVPQKVYKAENLTFYNENKKNLPKELIIPNNKYVDWCGLIEADADRWIKNQKCGVKNYEINCYIKNGKELIKEEDYLKVKEKSTEDLSSEKADSIENNCEYDDDLDR